MKKLIVIAACLAVFGAFYLYDYIISTQYSFALISQTTDTVVADGGSPSKYTIRLTKGGKAVEGHSISIVATNGTLRSSRMVTDENGEITITLYALYISATNLHRLATLYFT